MPLYPVQKAIGGQQALLDEYLPNAERNIFGGKVTLRDMLDFVRGKTAEEQVAGFAGPAINPALPVAVGQIKGLYHGSPYKFSKFANEKIGTGEGAQAFGYGHYLSESPDIAKGYAKPKYRVWELSDKDYNFTPKFMETEDILEQTLTGDKYAMEQMRKDLRTKINSGYITNKDLIDEFNKIDKALFKGTVKEKNPSLIYETTVNKGKPSSADVFLEWDKPVKKSLLKKIENNLNLKFKTENPTGEDIYTALRDFHDKRGYHGDKWASWSLKETGITGIKYPSGSLSGIEDSPYSNYVIFNPEDITIEAVK